MLNDWPYCNHINIIYFSRTLNILFPTKPILRCIPWPACTLSPAIKKMSHTTDRQTSHCLKAVLSIHSPPWITPKRFYAKTSIAHEYQKGEGADSYSKNEKSQGYAIVQSPSTQLPHFHHSGISDKPHELNYYLPLRLYYLTFTHLR